MSDLREFSVITGSPIIAPAIIEAESFKPEGAFFYFYVGDKIVGTHAQYGVVSVTEKKLGNRPRTR